MNTSKHILTRLADARNHFEGYNGPGIKVSRVNLGDAEWSEFKMVVRDMCCHTADYSLSLTEYMWNGIPVLHVVCPTHIGFEIEMPSPCG